MSDSVFRDLCKQFVEAVDQLTSHGDSASGPGHRLILTVDVDSLEELAEGARAALSEPLPPRVGHVLRLAEIIRELDGNHDKGADALAEAILSHPGIADVPALSEPVVGAAAPSDAEPSNAELIELRDCAYCPSSGERHDSETDSSWIYTSNYINWLYENGSIEEQEIYEAKGLREVFNAGRRWGTTPTPKVRAPSYEDLYDLADVFNGDPVPAMRRALELWGNCTTPTPIPVAERPWERDGWCDADGRCWFYRPAEIPCRLANGTLFRWVLDTPDWDGEPIHDTHSLPFHALPLPAAPGVGA